MLEATEEERFVKNIERNLENIPHEAGKDFGLIKEIFDKKYVVGGFVRDSILQVLYKYKFPIEDLDILVEDKEFDSKKFEFPQESLSRLGGLKLKYKEFTTDVFSMEDIYFLRNSLNKNVEQYLEKADLSTSALVYSLSENKIYGDLAMKEIMKKEINVLGNDLMKSAPTIARLVLHADKMNFKIGKKGIDYVRKNYSKDLDSEIKDWLNYKEIPHLFGLIKKNINSILPK